MNSNYALHEMLEVHEMAAFKTVCMTKSKTMQALVTDRSSSKFCSKTYNYHSSSFRSSVECCLK